MGDQLTLLFYFGLDAKFGLWRGCLEDWRVGWMYTYEGGESGRRCSGVGGRNLAHQTPLESRLQCVGVCMRL